jgi:hypothetical protein
VDCIASLGWGKKVGLTTSSAQASFADVKLVFAVIAADPV